MPGMYGEGDYDLAGFTVGAVNRKHYLPQLPQLREGDVIITLPSSGVHSNGFSLVRKVVEQSGLTMTDPCPWDASKSLGGFIMFLATFRRRAWPSPMVGPMYVVIVYGNMFQRVRGERENRLNLE